MTIKEIIDGLKFTVDMFLFDASTGETYTEPRNDMDKTTIDACKGAIELLERARWIPCSERLPEDVSDGEQFPIVVYCTKSRTVDVGWYEAVFKKWWRLESDEEIREEVIAWMPLPDAYEKKVRTRNEI